MKRFFDTKPVKAKVVPPREADEIKKEYGDLYFKAGDYQYQIYILQQSLDQVNLQLSKIAAEFKQRLELDKANAPTPKKEEAV